jgi:ankyrin repeat protein
MPRNETTTEAATEFNTDSAALMTKLTLAVDAAMTIKYKKILAKLSLIKPVTEQEKMIELFSDKNTAAEQEQAAQAAAQAKDRETAGTEEYTAAEAKAEETAALTLDDTGKPKLVMAKKAQVEALFNAAKDGNIKVIKFLLEIDVDVNARNADGNTALMLASQNGHEAAVKILTQAAAEQTAAIEVDEEGAAAAAEEVITSLNEIMTFLPSRQSILQSQNIELLTAQYEFIDECRLFVFDELFDTKLFKKYPEQFEELTSQNAKLEALKSTTNERKNLLLFFDEFKEWKYNSSIDNIEGRREEIFQMLTLPPEEEREGGRKAGSRLEPETGMTGLIENLQLIKSDYNEMPAEMEKEQQLKSDQSFLSAIKRAIDQFGSTEGRLGQVVGKGALGAQNALKELKPLFAADKIRYENLEKAKKFHAACYNDETEEVTELLKQDKWLLDSKDADGHTVLNKATVSGHIKLVTLLLEKGANVNATNSHQETALHAAAYWGHKGVVELLIDQGADLEAKNNKGHTALMYAAHNDQREVVELLTTKIEAQTAAAGGAPVAAAAAAGEARVAEAASAAMARVATATTLPPSQHPIRQQGKPEDQSHIV